jgi:iron uptake system EfeUOB component EfeO/EfeM
MKRNRKWLYGLAAAAMLSAAGCSFNQDMGQSSPPKEAQEVNTSDQSAIITGIKDVMVEVQKLEMYMKASSDQGTINKFGKSIAKKWDEFENDVEERYPDQYKKIEDNLYPLIAETGKPKLDLQKIKDLTQKVQKDLMAFLKQLQQ